MRIACWIPKDTNTHSEYVTIIFPLQQWWQEHALLLLYPYIACLFVIYHDSEVYSVNQFYMTTSVQVFLGFPVSISKSQDGSQDSKLLLHASHVALPT